LVVWSYSDEDRELVRFIKEMVSPRLPALTLIDINRTGKFDGVIRLRNRLANLTEH
jgi:hypothetical protein